MSEELEAAGAFATAGLAAGALESRTGAHAEEAGHGACLNCGTTLSGRFCHTCGQSAHVHHSLLHLAEEVLHGLFHFDAKGWRTLPLLVARPGLLTRRYIEGQRARYVSPLALFLFMVFLMFFAASLTASKPTAVDETGEARLELEKELAAARKDEAKALEALTKARANGQDVKSAEEDVADAHRDVVTAQTGLQAVAIAASAVSAVASGAASASAGGTSGAAVIASPDATWTLGRNYRTGHPRFDAALNHAAANPELTIYKLKNTAYKFSFMLVPISLPFLWLLFVFRPGIAVYDHAVFVLYSLSFMSLLVVVLTLCSASGLSAPIPYLAVLLPPLHMGMQLRETYRLGVYPTLWRTAVLLVVASIVFVIFVLFIIYVTMV
jgi:hypothetical protein